VVSAEVAICGISGSFGISVDTESFVGWDKSRAETGFGDSDSFSSIFTFTSDRFSVDVATGLEAFDWLSVSKGNSLFLSGFDVEDIVEMTFVSSSSVVGTDGFSVSADFVGTASTDGTAAAGGTAATDDGTATGDVSFDAASVDGVFAGDGDSFGDVSFVEGGGIGSSKHGSKEDEEIFLVLSLFGISSFFGFSSFLIGVSFCVDSS
jgi:hypothetical protein